MWPKQVCYFNTPFSRVKSDFFKLMNNLVFGKTMENIRKRVDVCLVTREDKHLKLRIKATFVTSKIFNEIFVAVHKMQETLTLNRPAFAGMCFLDISKPLMFNLYYNFIKKNYCEKTRLPFKNTDSLT